MIGFPFTYRSLYSHTIFLWHGEKETPKSKYKELIKRRSKVPEKNMFKGNAQFIFLRNL